MAAPSPLPICVTMGEPAGIGGELSLLAWLRRQPWTRPFLVLDDPARLRRIARDQGWSVPVEVVDTCADAFSVFQQALPVLPLGAEVWANAGEPRPENAAVVIESIERAVDLTATSAAAAVVTNPINKAVLSRSGRFPFPGHTEFLGFLAGVDRTVMMLATETFRVVPLTVHVPLRSVPGLVTRETIVGAAHIVQQALRRFLGIARPRIAVAGLNPHAGESGTMGDEEATIIGPAIEELRASGIEAFGPMSADTMFTERARATYDVAICMYHDQALIPIKTLAMDSGVNVTLGLPFVRTSPDHGTAFDIAGSGKARPDSFIAALAMADRMARARFSTPTSQR